MDQTMVPTLTVKPITRPMSPSLYNSLKLCALKGLLEAANEPTLLPKNVKGRIGSVKHRLIECISNRRLSLTEIRSLWDRLISEEERNMEGSYTCSHLLPLRNHKGYNVEKESSIRLTERSAHRMHGRVGQNTPSFANTDPSPKQFEIKLTTIDEKITGKIDQIVRSPNNETYIIDLKTGDIFDPGTTNVKTNYRLQLHIYAGLFNDKYNAWPTKLFIETMDQKRHEVIFDEDVCKRLLEEVKTLRDDINEKIAHGCNEVDLARPSPSSCKYCDYRPACSAYWNTRSEDSEWPKDVAGKIKKTEKFRDRIRIELLTQYGTSIVRELSPERSEFLDGENKNVRICNLFSDGNNYRAFKEGPMTIGYNF